MTLFIRLFARQSIRPSIHSSDFSSVQIIFVPKKFVVRLEISHKSIYKIQYIWNLHEKGFFPTFFVILEVYFGINQFGSFSSDSSFEVSCQLSNIWMFWIKLHSRTFHSFRHQFTVWQIITGCSNSNHHPLVLLTGSPFWIHYRYE